MSNSSVLVVEGLSRDYESGGKTLRVLDDVSFRLDAGEVFAIVGPSGSGKTTLLGLCAGLDDPTAGRVVLCGHELQKLDENARARVRNENIGFVFQTFQLIHTLTALENVMVPAELRGDRGARQAAMDLLDRVELAERMSHYPKQLSGGEQQRVAIARAFINRPTVLFADEPTGNLDGETGGRIESLLFDLNADAGTTLVIVTHDLELASRADRILQLRSGRVVHQDHNDLLLSDVREVQ